MPPYRKEIKSTCRWEDCTAMAGWEVFSHAGENYGNYCLRHAIMKVAEIKEKEAVRGGFGEGDDNRPLLRVHFGQGGSMTGKPHSPNTNEELE